MQPKKYPPQESPKKCSHCQTVKPPEDFAKNSRVKSGLHHLCRPCHYKYNKKQLAKRKSEGYVRKKPDPSANVRYVNKPEVRRKKRDSWLRRAFGITLETYDLLLEQQKGVCKICKEPSKKSFLCVDHCHKTLLIRGLICAPCNRGIGNLKDSVEILDSAISYIQEASTGLFITPEKHAEFENRKNKRGSKRNRNLDRS